MTAEIAVLNRNGIALAADSAVTISGSAGMKTFDTVNKVFTLSKVHPVGIMVFGNAEFMRFPWETIVKMYRQQKGAKNEDSVDEWAKDFCSWLENFGNIRPEDIEENITNILFARFSEVLKHAMSMARSRKVAIASPDYVEILSSVVNRRIEALASRRDVLTDTQQKAVRETYSDLITRLVNDHFRTHENPNLLETATELAWLWLFKDVYSEHSSGIVVAGFGAREVFPALKHFDTEGYVGKAIKISQTTESEITRDMSAAIVPFAQKEMVQAFMSGVDPTFSDNMLRAFNRTLIQGCLDVLEKYGEPGNKTDEVRAKIGEAAREGLESLFGEIASYSEDRFSGPIIGMVSLLPKDELPGLAEALVSLTSVKRHFSHEVETVGGPIDVALITKGDGFIWIKRKHYFRPELNPHFQNNYLWGLDAGGTDGRVETVSSRKGTRGREEAPRPKAEESS